MKRFWRLLEFIGSIIVLLITIIVLVGIALGYEPVLSTGATLPDWDALGFFATIAFSISTLIISSFALWHSINTTHKQNKIALFEKRCSCILELLKVKKWVAEIEKLPYSERVVGMYILIFSEIYSFEYGIDTSPSKSFNPIPILYTVDLKCQQTKLLFDIDEEIIDKFLNNYSKIIWGLVNKQDTIDNDMKNFIAFMNEFDKNIEHLKKQLQL